MNSIREDIKKEMNMARLDKNIMCDLLLRIVNEIENIQGVNLVSPEPEAEAEAVTEPEAVPEPEAEAESVPEPEAEASPEPEAEASPEPEAVVKPKKSKK